MANVNEAFLDLENNYVFSEINEKLNRYKEKNKDTKVISLGIGDVSLPLAKTVIDAMQKAVEEMSKKETFKGYGIVQGYDFLIEKILKWEYERLNIKLEKDEIFIGSGTKGDLAGIIELLGVDNTVALMDPVYPAYKEANIMNGRKSIKYLQGTEENGFKIQIPEEAVDIIYLCSPNNPTRYSAKLRRIKKMGRLCKKESFNNTI